MSRRRPAAAKTIATVAVAVSGVLAAACSIPTDEEARSVEDTRQLTTTEPEVPETIADEEDSRFRLPLFFFNDEDGLVRISRPQEETPVVQDILDALASPPAEEELEEFPGISTRFLPEMQPMAIDRTEDGLLTVAVQGPELREFAETNPERVQRIYTQIVCSMSATSIITTVQIQDEEGAIRVQGDDGAVLDRPLGSADVNECITAEEARLQAAAEAEAAEAEAEDASENGGADGESG